ncbi:hypothetical protein HXX76_015978 [Chlamydomonas incerta]|uniref:phytol kinase n=1 Tax=Chlamydomonas incerta TaxID=51695 RepID=A0A835SLB8_CHLIN|nr:hypothetical protein HXX76_015978 [Chlamydomonas incerta]|eukprot:KAG2422510.1 hypothetical protein HXX76_015978 [Chlamydomonas incerta]
MLTALDKQNAALVAKALVQADILNVYAALASRHHSPGFCRLAVVTLATNVMRVMVSQMLADPSVASATLAAFSHSHALEHLAAAILRAAAQPEPPSRDPRVPTFNVLAVASSMCYLLDVLCAAYRATERNTPQQEQEPQATCSGGCTTGAGSATRGAGAEGGSLSAAAPAAEPAHGSASHEGPAAGAVESAARGGIERLPPLLPLLQGPCLQCFLVWVLFCTRERTAAGETAAAAAAASAGAGSSSSGGSGARNSTAAAGVPSGGPAAAACGLPAALVGALRPGDVRENGGLFAALRTLTDGPPRLPVAPGFPRCSPEPQSQARAASPPPPPQQQQQQEPGPGRGVARPQLACVCVYDLARGCRVGSSGPRPLDRFARTSAAGLLASLLPQLPPRQAAARLPGLWAALVPWLPDLACRDFELCPGTHGGTAVQAAGLLLGLQLEPESAGGGGARRSWLQQPAPCCQHPYQFQHPGPPSYSQGEAPCYSLRCALDAGLLGGLERALRQPVVLLQSTPANDEPNAARLLTVLRHLLISTGVWPASVAHGPLAQAAGLISTLAVDALAVSTVARDQGEIPLADLVECARGLPAAGVPPNAGHANLKLGCCLAGMLHQLFAAIEGGCGGLSARWAQQQQQQQLEAEQEQGQELQQQQQEQQQEQGQELQQEQQQQEPQQEAGQITSPPGRWREVWQDAEWGAWVVASGGVPPPGTLAAAQQRLLCSLAVHMWANYIGYTAASIIRGLPEGPLSSDACAALRLLLQVITRVIVQVLATGQRAWHAASSAQALSETLGREDGDGEAVDDVPAPKEAVATLQELDEAAEVEAVAKAAEESWADVDGCNHLSVAGIVELVPAVVQSGDRQLQSMLLRLLALWWPHNSHKALAFFAVALRDWPSGRDDDDEDAAAAQCEATAAGTGEAGAGAPAPAGDGSSSGGPHGRGHAQCDKVTPQLAALASAHGWPELAEMVLLGPVVTRRVLGDAVLQPGADKTALRTAIAEKHDTWLDGMQPAAERLWESVAAADWFVELSAQQAWLLSPFEVSRQLQAAACSGGAGAAGGSSSSTAGCGGGGGGASACDGVRLCGNSVCNKLDDPTAVLAPGAGKTCKRCRAVIYCSGTCQLQHWQEGGHERACPLFAAAAAAKR